MNKDVVCIHTYTETHTPSDATMKKIQCGQGLGVPSRGSLIGLGKSRVSQGPGDFVRDLGEL